MGGLLVGLSTFQAEFDFGVPQFRAVLQPAMIALAAGGAVVAARVWIGRDRFAAGAVAGLLAGKLVSPKLRLLAGAIGTGLTFSAATNTCAMGNALSKMPWNKTASEPTAAAINQIPAGN